MGPEAQPTPASASTLRFGPFRVLRSRRLLLEGDRQVRLSSRAFDVLVALIDRAGQVVDKRDLIAAVWPNTVVEETNLRVHITALRRALGDQEGDGRYIVNVPGRGYSFAGTLTPEANESPPPEMAPARERGSSLPASLTRMVGRDPILTTLVEIVPVRRLVTLVGVGGVGKSTLALEVAKKLSGEFPDGAHFIHLAAIANSALVLATVATEIGLTLSNDDPLASLVAFLRQKRVLLVLDNCEHVIGAVAQLAETLLRGTDRLSILATSREPLGAEGEWQTRLQPLDIPPVECTSAAQARSYSAVEVFVERAATRGYAFTLTDANAPFLCEICRRLDGIPLALELVAARLDRLGIQDLATRLSDRFLLSAGGRRTAAPRHQTLRAALEWSHELLDEHERIALRRLSAFKGSFTVDSAVALVTQPPLNEQSAFDAVMSLTEKSLVTTEVSEQMARHRLLHTTRAYACEKLAESTDIPAVWQWHARHHWDLLRTAEIDWEALQRPAWVRKYAPAIDDVRAALDWAFSADGDVELGAAITLTAVPFAFQMALQDEFRERLETALRVLSETGLQDRTLPDRLHQAWKLLSLDAQRLNPDAAPEAATPSRRESAENSPPGQSLVNATTLEIEAGRYDVAVLKARQMAGVAQRSGQPMALLLSERLMAQVLHFNGQHQQARMLAQKVLQQADQAIALVHQPLAVDRRVSMRIVLARIAWMEGSFYRARQIVDESLEYAADDGPFSLCQALALAACPIAFWQGDYPRARSLAARLIEEASRYRLGYWHTYGEWYERAGAAGETGLAPGSEFPLSGLLLDTLLTIDPERVPAQSRNQLREMSASWCAPELLRIQGESLLRNSTREDTSRAEELLVKAVDLAHAQGAPGWQLRAATSLASLWQQIGRVEAARQVLSAARNAVQQEHDSRDMIKARELYDRLG